MSKISVSHKRYDPNSTEGARAVEKFRRNFEVCRATLLRIDKGIFQPWWRNLFRAIPFEEYGADLVKLCVQIDNLKLDAEVFERGAANGERQEIVLMRTFLAKYREAASILYEICRGLSRRYSWKAYRADVARYRLALGSPIGPSRVQSLV